MASGPRAAAIFLNRGAGGAGQDRVGRTVELARHALDADLHVTETREPAEFEAWLSEHVAAYDTAVIVGGDGSLSVGYNVAAAREGLTLGYIPAGFGNASAHLLRLPREPEGIADVLRLADARPVDLVTVGERLALFAGAGWDARVAGRYAAAGANRMRGWASAVVRSVPDLLSRQSVEVHADGWSVHRGPIELVIVGTTPYYGRGLRVNPGARPDAGRLALRIYPGPAPRLAIEAGRWALGARPQAERIDALEVTIRTLDGAGIPVQADGDLIGERAEWTFALRPAAVRLIGRWS
jgi:diacylglycerol kinase family enzyme